MNRDSLNEILHDRQMAADGAAIEILTLEDRIADLERDRDVLQELLHAAVDQLHLAHLREQRLREMVREQAQTIRRLRSLVTVTSADRRAA